MNEIFQFVYLRDDTMVSKWNFMFCAHETYDNEKFQIFIKVNFIEFQFETIIYYFHITFWV
jgi:hypothetical protein